MFRRIYTEGKLPDGRIITTDNRYPKGASYIEYQRLDAALVVAYGNTNCRTIGEFMTPKLLITGFFQDGY